MAEPTEAEVRIMLQKAVDFLNELRVDAGDSASDYLELIETFTKNLSTDFLSQIASGIDSFRSGIVGAQDSASGILTPIFLEFARISDIPESDISSIFVRLRQDWVDRSITIKTRGFSFGTPVADGGNVGDGIIHRLNTDKDGFNKENQNADAKIATVTSDANSGSLQHAESVEFRGQEAEPDTILIAGSGLVETIGALTGLDTESFILNPSFTDTTGASGVGLLTAIGSWTASGGDLLLNFEFESKEFYRALGNEVDPRALRITGNTTLSQSFVDGASFNPSTPYYIQIAYNVDNITSGTLKLKFGAVSATADLSVGSGWKVLRIAIGDDNWFQKFNKTDPFIEISTTALVGSHVLIDDVVVGAYTNFNGSWYAVVGGRTAFLNDDEFTWADTIATEGKIGHQIFRRFNEYLPSSGSPTISDP